MPQRHPHRNHASEAHNRAVLKGAGTSGELSLIAELVDLSFEELETLKLSAAQMETSKETHKLIQVRRFIAIFEPRRPENWLNLGRAYEQAGDKEQAAVCQRTARAVSQATQGTHSAATKVTGTLRRSA